MFLSNFTILENEVKISHHFCNGLMLTLAHQAIVKIPKLVFQSQCDHFWERNKTKNVTN